MYELELGTISFRQLQKIERVDFKKLKAYLCASNSKTALQGTVSDATFFEHAYPPLYTSQVVVGWLQTS